MIGELVGGAADGAKVLLVVAPIEIRVPVLAGPTFSTIRYVRPRLDAWPGPTEIVGFELVEEGPS